MRALLIDNHDSFTGNLARLWWQVTGQLPLVVPHDAAPNFNDAAATPRPLFGSHIPCQLKYLCRN